MTGVARLSRAPLLAPGDVAEITGFARITVYRALDTGELVGFKAGTGPRARWRIRIEDVERWLHCPPGEHFANVRRTR